MIVKEKFQEAITTTVLKHMNLNISTAKIFAGMATGLIDFGSVKVTRLAQGFQGMLTSCTRALERFYAKHYISTMDLGMIVYDLLTLKYRGPFTIIIDRTIWYFGTKTINIFVISILFGNTTVPLLVDVSGKDGASNFKWRKKLIDQLVLFLGRDKIKAILGDREFVGDEWFQDLYSNKLPFVFRIRNNFYVTVARFGRIRVDLLMANVQNNECRQMKAMISGIPVIIAATRSKTGELVIVVASRVKGNILKQYKARWFIELFFKSIKSMDFNLEETHITDPARIKMLMAAIAVATCLVVQSGFFKHRTKPIRFKKHCRSAFSVFTYGLRFVRLTKKLWLKRNWQGKLTALLKRKNLLNNKQLLFSA